jgi:delta 1-pyrroline-5-carboxylate dehydrogenase
MYSEISRCTEKKFALSNLIREDSTSQMPSSSCQNAIYQQSSLALLNILSILTQLLVHVVKYDYHICILCAFAACTQDEVNQCVESAKAAQKLWAKTPLWKRAEALHRFAAILKDQKAPIADALVKEVAKCLKDAITEVIFNEEVLCIALLGIPTIFLKCIHFCNYGTMFSINI